MVKKPELYQIKLIAPEIDSLEEIRSGGYKVVYRAEINDHVEAVKLVEIPFDENDDEDAE